MKGEKEEKKILKIITESDLSAWEIFGMLEGIKFQLFWMTMKECEEKCTH